MKASGGKFRITVSAVGYVPFVVVERALRPGVKSRFSVALEELQPNVEKS